jgi:hypothetical protein
VGLIQAERTALDATYAIRRWSRSSEDERAARESQEGFMNIIIIGVQIALYGENEQNGYREEGRIGRLLHARRRSSLKEHATGQE